LSHRRLCFASTRGLLFGGARDLLGTLRRFDGGALSLDRCRQHITAFLGNAGHVVAAGLQRRDGGPGRVRFVRRGRGRLVETFDDCTNIVLDGIGELLHLTRALVRRFRERTHFVGDNGEPATMITGASGFDRRVQREEIRLIGNATHRLGDFADIPGAPLELGNDAHRCQMTFGVALDGAGGHRNPVARVGERRHNDLGLLARDLGFMLRRGEAGNNAPDGRRLLLCSTRRFFGAARNLRHRAGQFSGRRGRLRQTARELLGCGRHPLCNGLVT
jgi:hypothetical protein